MCVEDDCYGWDDMCGTAWNPWLVICLPVAFFVLVIGILLSVLWRDDDDGLVAVGIVFCVLGGFIVVLALVMCMRRQDYYARNAAPPPTVMYDYATPPPRQMHSGRDFYVEDPEPLPPPASMNRGFHASPYTEAAPVHYATGPSPGGRHGVWYPEAPPGFRSPSTGSLYRERDPYSGRHVYQPRYSGDPY